MEQILSNISKKKKLINIIREKSNIKITNKIIIQELINDGSLDNIIYRIDNKKVIIQKSPINPKGYLTGYEQFINILDNFITHVINIVDSPELIMDIIINCLNNDPSILLCKKYYHDAGNLEFYTLKFDILIITIFYKNILMLKDKLTRELEIIHLDIEKIDINDKKDILYLASLIEEIVIVNRNNYKILALFNNISNDKYNLYLDWYCMLILNYEKNIKFILEYRRLKKTPKESF